MGRQNKMTQETAAELQPGGALTRAELHRLVAFAGPSGYVVLSYFAIGVPQTADYT